MIVDFNSGRAYGIRIRVRRVKANVSCPVDERSIWFVMVAPLRVELSSSVRETGVLTNRRRWGRHNKSYVMVAHGGIEPPLYRRERSFLTTRRMGHMVATTGIEPACQLRHRVKTCSPAIRDRRDIRIFIVGPFSRNFPLLEGRFYQIIAVVRPHRSRLT